MLFGGLVEVVVVAVVNKYLLLIEEQEEEEKELDDGSEMGDDWECCDGDTDEIVDDELVESEPIGVWLLVVVRKL